MSIIVVMRFVLSITTISGLCAGITLSVRISKSHNTLPYFQLRARGDVSTLSRLSQTIMLTYIPVKNLGYIVVSL